VFAKGFGVRELGKPEPVNPDTLFKIASNSKAFTSAALAVLVDGGLLSWDSPVIDYIPDFRLSDPWVTANFTVTDLLTHRSGLRAFVGDQMLWPESNLFTRADIIRALRYFELVSPFRTEYAYDNLLYVVAGEIIPAVSGKSWGKFLEQRIMRPAGMKRCFADRIPKRQMRNLASPHGVVEGSLSIIERGRITPERPLNAAAGGVVCSLEDMLTWTGLQLAQGRSKTGQALFSAAQSEEMWRPHTLRSVSESDRELNRTNFSAYGLGWRLADVHGYLEVSHTGSLDGFRSNLVLIPELELGVVLLSNGSNSTARKAVVNQVVRSFMPVEQLDWIQLYLDEIEERRQQQSAAELAQEPAEQAPQACCAPDLSLFTGRFRSPWFGDVNIRQENDVLVLAAEKSPRFVGSIAHHNSNRFVLRWTDRTLNGDAWVMFDQDESGKATGMSMRALSERGDYDFQDLVFTRVE